MKKILTFLYVLFTTFAVAQSPEDSINVVGSGLGTTFFQNDRILQPGDLKHITRDHPEAHKYMKKAATNNGFGVFFATAGGVLIGWPLGTALGGGDPNWALAGVGGGLALLSIPLASGYVKNARKGAEIYNDGLASTSFKQQRLQWNLALSQDGVGLQLRF